MAASQAQLIDKQLQVYERWDAKQRERLRLLITDELLEEHRAKPLGQHSDALDRVLQYLRRQPAAGKYVAVMTKPWSEYKIGVLPGVRGQRASIIEDEIYPTENAVLHGIFVRRVHDVIGG